MEIKLRELFKRLEFKTTFYFAVTVFFIVLLVGLISKVEFVYIIKRILIAEIIFIPLGFGIGYILNMIILVQNGSNPKVESEAVTEVETNDSDSKVMDDKVNDSESGSEEVVEELDGVELEVEDEEKGDVNLDGDISNQTEVVADNKTSSVVDELKKLKNIGKESLGKYIIVDDKKIVNDPEVIAKAVRTMMNRE